MNSPDQSQNQWRRVLKSRSHNFQTKAKRVLPSIVVAASFLFVSACSDSIVSNCDLPEGPLPVSARFSDIESRVFATTCATSGCHASGSPQAGLDLSPGRAYDALVNVASRYYPAQRLVEPASSASSVLIGVLRQDIQPVMPPTGPIASAIIDSIAAWIDNGALRD
jgi:hypothetical protein